MTAPMVKCIDPNCYVYVATPGTRCPAHAMGQTIVVPTPIPAVIPTPPPYIEKAADGAPDLTTIRRPEVKDAWANLSTYACSTCRFFVPKDGPGKPQGRCRRHAPTLDGYPVVYAEDWCGDHKLGTNPSRSQ